MKQNTQTSSKPKTLADVTEIYPEDPTHAEFRKQAEKHFKRKDIFIVHNGDEMEAVILGQQAAPASSKPVSKLVEKAVAVETTDYMFEALPTYIRHQAKAYVYDLIHGTNYYGVRRRMQREGKDRAFEASIGLVRK